ncbi:hypothetical protein EDD86DRAFT_102691 [Gorgonomyces haynaldii]|nr:hypothetical protein EDD86DRAFT_102691 [Gorgonomyces haynaldii]
MQLYWRTSTVQIQFMSLLFSVSLQHTGRQDVFTTHVVNPVHAILVPICKRLEQCLWVRTWQELIHSAVLVQDGRDIGSAWIRRHSHSHAFLHWLSLRQTTTAKELAVNRHRSLKHQRHVARCLNSIDEILKSTETLACHQSGLPSSLCL